MINVSESFAKLTLISVGCYVLVLLIALLYRAFRSGGDIIAIIVGILYYFGSPLLLIGASFSTARIAILLVVSESMPTAFRTGLYIIFVILAMMLAIVYQTMLGGTFFGQ
jgi:hypothetical protein